MCFLKFVYICQIVSNEILCLIKRNWFRFDLPEPCYSNIYVIVIVKNSNRPIQNLLIVLNECVWYTRKRKR